MKEIISCCLTIMMGLCVFPFSTSVQSESLNGAQILETQARRAQELTRLAHEAKVADQQANIAQATKRLRNAGGYHRPDTDNNNVDRWTMNREGINRREVEDVSLSYSDRVLKNGDDFEIPKLKAIDGNSAILRTIKYGTLVATPGSVLPDGFTVMSIETNKGVTLVRDGVTYIAPFSWD